MDKKCTKCLQFKDLSLFHKEIKGKYGVKSRCVKCVTEVSQNWKANNQEKEKQSRKKWNMNNKEKHKESTYLWRKNNKQYHSEYVAEYQKERKLKEPQFKFLSNMRSLLYNHLVRKNLKKHKKLELYLGCDFESFKNKIELQFTKEMTWDNYGKYWSIDHICPCDQAQNEEELIKLQNYINLMPVKSYGEGGNFQKSNKKVPEGEQLCIQLLGRNWID